MTVSKPKIVAYYRVSTKSQGESGLGLEAQQATVEAYRAVTGATLVCGYTEIESGKDDDRPELAKALTHARRAKAKLVVAKLDRLARKVSFLSALMDSGVDLYFCDIPGSDRFTTHILAAVAEKEAKDISERTKRGLAALKARGVKLGSARPGHWDGREQARLDGARKGNAKSVEARQEKARKYHEDFCPVVLELKAQGLTLQQIADRLNADDGMGGTPTGKQWTVVYVCRFLKRCEARQATAQ